MQPNSYKYHSRTVVALELLQKKVDFCDDQHNKGYTLIKLSLYLLIRQLSSLAHNVKK